MIGGVIVKKIIRKNYVLILIIILLVIFGITLFSTFTKYEQPFIDFYNNIDFHYNLITFNSVIAGFLFSGISILVSLISNPSIKRLWDNGYLDGLYHSGGTGIFMSIISIITSFVIVLIPFNIDDHLHFFKVLLTFEVTLSIGSLVLFLYCTIELIYSIEILRKTK